MDINWCSTRIERCLQESSSNCWKRNFIHFIWWSWEHIFDVKTGKGSLMNHGKWKNPGWTTAHLKTMKNVMKPFCWRRQHSILPFINLETRNLPDSLDTYELLVELFKLEEFVYMVLRNKKEKFVQDLFFGLIEKCKSGGRKQRFPCEQLKGFLSLTLR